MFGADWVRFQHYVRELCALCSSVVNSLLIYLIVTKSPKELGSYKYLMICISAYEIVYSLLDVVVSPFFDTVGPAYMMIVMTRGKLFPNSVYLVLAAVYTGFFGLSMAFFAIHFIYRYLVAIRSNILDSFNSLKLFIWLSVPLFVGVSWALICIFLLKPSEYTISYVSLEVLRRYGMRMDDFVSFTAHFYEKVSNHKTVFHVTPFIGILIMSFYTGASLVIACYFSIKCYIHIRSMINTSSVSDKYQALQSQLFFALVAQTAVPIVLMHIPGFVILVLVALNVEASGATRVFSMTVSLYTALDSIPVLLIVKPYRTVLVEYAKKVWKRVGKSVNWLL